MPDAPLFFGTYCRGGMFTGPVVRRYPPSRPQRRVAQVDDAIIERVLTGGYHGSDQHGGAGEPAGEPRRQRDQHTAAAAGARGSGQRGRDVDAFRVHRKLIGDYKSLTTSAVSPRDPRISQYVGDALAQDDQWPEPWLSLKPTGRSRQDLWIGGLVQRPPTR